MFCILPRVDSSCMSKSERPLILFAPPEQNDPPRGQFSARERQTYSPARVAEHRPVGSTLLNGLLRTYPYLFQVCGSDNVAAFIPAGSGLRNRPAGMEYSRNRKSY